MLTWQAILSRKLTTVSQCCLSIGLFTSAGGLNTYKTETCGTTINKRCENITTDQGAHRPLEVVFQDCVIEWTSNKSDFHKILST